MEQDAALAVGKCKVAMRFQHRRDKLVQRLLVLWSRKKQAFRTSQKLAN